MTDRTDVTEGAATIGSTPPDPAGSRPGIISCLLLSAWCGLVAGLLEVGAIVLRKQVFDSDHLYRMSRDFVWMVPLTNLGLFLALGVLGCGIAAAWPHRGRWLLRRAACALTILPSLLIALPWIHEIALATVALGVSARLVPLIERDRRILGRFARVGLPAAIAVVAILAGSLRASDRIKRMREETRPLPPPGAPSILLIVLDTVAAGHLSLHGYERATSPTLVELAGRGIRFDSARAPSSWTLPSHATMFTGRWLHELTVGWATPLDRTWPTLAEFLGDRGYATAGFVANTHYCGTDSGLARGFTKYRDFAVDGLAALRMSALVDRALRGAQAIVGLAEDWLESVGLRPAIRRFWRSLDADRKGAATVNREFLGWLSGRTQPERPFFAFLNYYDAHYPYELPPGRFRRFGVEPADDYQRTLIERWWELDKSTLTPQGVAFAVDAYDDCIADLDEQLGRLIDELDRRGALEHTWLIVTSDHGESFGEHPGIFCHGRSLYDTEVHVPLLVVPPGGATKQAVDAAVSLRDLAATIVDVAGLRAGAPFPGASLARFWERPSPAAAARRPPLSPALAEVVPNDPGDRDAWGVPRPLPPLGALKDGGWSYIRREADARVEELFRLRDDPRERRDRADDPGARATLEQMRAALDRWTGGPLAAERFGR